MSHRRQDLSAWIDAEARGASDDGDAHFAALASAWLPRVEPSAGFTARVMAALPADRRLRAAAGLLASWWTRGAIGAAVVIVGAGLATLTPARAWAAGGAGLTVLAAIVWAASAVSSVLVAGAASTWTVFWSLGQAANAALGTGMGLLVIGANLALASAAFVGLARVLALGKEES